MDVARTISSQPTEPLNLTSRGGEEIENCKPSFQTIRRHVLLDVNDHFLMKDKHQNRQVLPLHCYVFVLFTYNTHFGLYQSKHIHQKRRGKAGRL